MSSVETRILKGIALKAAIAAPLAALAGYLIRGSHAAVGATAGIALVVGVFALSAIPAAWAARISPGVLGAVSMFGFFFRLAAMTGALFLLKKLPFINFGAMALTFGVSYLVLLSAEAKAWLEATRRDEAQKAAPDSLGAEGA